MSVSTDSIICYGFELPEEFEVPWDAEPWESDFENWSANKLGLAHPTVDFGSESKPLYEAYWKAKRELSFPVELVRHCSSDYPMLILAVPKTCVTASRGNPQALDFQALILAKDENLGAFNRALADWGIECGELKWLLCSYWG